jgi:hypothetical protein
VTSFFVGPNVIRIISDGLGSFKAITLGKKTVGNKRLSSEYGLTKLSVIATLRGFTLLDGSMCN